MDANNFDKLVKVVTENILEKIDLKSNSKISEKSCLILSSNIGFGFTEYQNYIMNNYPGYELYLGSNEEFSKMHYIKDNKNINFIKFDMKNSEFLNLLDAVETIIIIGHKISQLKALTVTDDSEDINHIILSGLMANKSVIVMINTNAVMFNKIIDIVYDVKNMGINVINIQDNNKSSLDKVDLITEEYVEKLKQSGLNNIVLSKKQLITPLAKDKLRELKIRIDFTEEEK